MLDQSSDFQDNDHYINIKEIVELHAICFCFATTSRVTSTLKLPRETAYERNSLSFQMLNMANNSVELKLAGVTRKTVVMPSLDATVLDLKSEIAKSNGASSNTVINRQFLYLVIVNGCACCFNLLRGDSFATAASVKTCTGWPAKPSMASCPASTGLNICQDLKLIVGGKRLQVCSEMSCNVLLSVFPSSPSDWHHVPMQKCIAVTLLTVVWQQDDSKPLREYGVTASSRILVLGAHSAEAQQAMSDQETRGREHQERAERLQRLKSAAEALAKRSGSKYVPRSGGPIYVGLCPKSKSAAVQ